MLQAFNKELSFAWTIYQLSRWECGAGGTQTARRCKKEWRMPSLNCSESSLLWFTSKSQWKCGWQRIWQIIRCTLHKWKIWCSMQKVGFAVAFTRTCLNNKGVRNELGQGLVLDIQYSYVYFTYIPIPDYCCSCTQYITSLLQYPVRHRTFGIKTHSSIQKHVHLIPWDWTLIFKRGSTPVPTTMPSYKTTIQRYEECTTLVPGTLPCSHPSSLLCSSHNCTNNTF
jgi:hypothetical protein